MELIKNLCNEYFTSELKLPYEKEKRKLYEFEANNIFGEHGKKIEERTIKEMLKYSFVNLDKASGPTSHQMSALVKNILNLNKAGHGGTLDPKVTGVLPIALEKSTKVIHYLLNAGKEYVAVAHLHKTIGFDKIKKIERKFVGTIIQVPPVRSAVKRRPRKRKIYYLKILDYDEEKKNLIFKVGTEAGTYIRTLCVDIGKYLGVGAHMIELRRTKAATFDESNAVNIVDLKDSYFIWKKLGEEKYLREKLIPIEKAIDHLPKVYLDDVAISAVLFGAKIAVPGVIKIEEYKLKESLAVFSMKGELIAIAKPIVSFDKFLEMKKNNKGLFAKTDTVLRERDYFPPLWKRKK